MSDKVKTEVRENKLYVEGEEAPFVQGAIRRLLLEVDNLTFHDSFEIADGKANRSRALRGEAAMKGDKLRIAGSDKPAVSRLRFAARPAPANPDPFNGKKVSYDWRANLGYIPYDGEIGIDEAWYVEMYVPEAEFDILMGEYRAGRADRLHVRLRTDLWVADDDWYVPVAFGVTWHFVPGDRGSVDFPRTGWGDVGQIIWSADVAEPTTAMPAPPLPPAPVERPELDTPSYPSLKGLERWLKVIAGLLALIALALIFGR